MINEAFHVKFLRQEVDRKFTFETGSSNSEVERAPLTSRHHLRSGFDVNFMDDVGQTLLNWAAAFGTLEMVEYLLEHGADVNRGLKSSSLHYAACFGRPNIVKLLLQYGADPDLRDEDGHTPLEKAQERGDEWHRQVIETLENPSKFGGLGVWRS